MCRYFTVHLSDSKFCLLMTYSYYKKNHLTIHNPFSLKGKMNRNQRNYKIHRHGSLCICARLTSKHLCHRALQNIK